MNIVPPTHSTCSRNVSLFQVWAASGYYDLREPLAGGKMRTADLRTCGPAKG